jgi:hypothetical protein
MVDPVHVAQFVLVENVNALSYALGAWTTQLARAVNR